MAPVSKSASLQEYKWGADCDGWVLVDEASLSVKQEKMPPGSAEALHYHKEARQFFYILEGTAEIEVESKRHTVLAGQGFYITPGLKHRIMNNGSVALEFILSSQPTTNNDRFNCS